MINISPQDKIHAITAETGMFFNILLKSAKATRISEVGTSAGYSTLWFADAPNEEGNCHSRERPF